METTWDSEKCCFGDSDRFVPPGSFVKDTVFTVYRHLDLFPLKRVTLRSANMFIYIIYSSFCLRTVFIPNKPWRVLFPLSTHALIKLNISCLHLERHFVNVKLACLPWMQLKKFSDSKLKP